MGAKITELTRVVTDIMLMLANKNYDSLANLTLGKRLSADEICLAISEYGREIILPPQSAYKQFLEVIQIQASQLPSWSIEMSLWTKEEGRSDLSLELTITQIDGIFQVEIESIHVL